MGQGKARPTLLALASATAITVSAAPAQAETEEHCIADIGTGGEQCFATYVEAIDAAEEQIGRTLHAQQRELRTGSDPVRTSADEWNVVIGTYFTDSDFGGSSLTLYGNSLCSGGDDIDFWYTFGPDWQNVFSSVQPWANCAIWLHSEEDHQGDRDGPFRENTGDIGGLMNDRAVSTSLG